MTVAPATIQDLASLWVNHCGRNLGIVGDTKHKKTGTSYHLGRSDLAAGAYSAKLKRDRDGLSEAASALDLGKLDGGIGKLRTFSNWLVNRAEAGLTPDIREIIWSPDGVEVRRWDSSLKPNGKVIVSLRRHADKSIQVVNPGNGDATHFRHTHISFYRDSEFRPKVAYFKPFFDQPAPNPVHQPDHGDEPDPNPDDDVNPNPDGELDPNPDGELVPTPGAVFVKVQPFPQPRSTLSGIAHEFGTTVAQLLAFPENKGFRDNPGLVFAGQQVRVR